MKTFIFDFDGTIADSAALLRDMADELLPSIGVEKITDKQIEEMRKMTILQGFRYLKIPVHKLPAIVIQSKQLVANRLDKLEPVKGISEVLEGLSKLNVSLGILTSNSANNVESFLKKHKLDQHFDFVQSGAGVFTKNRKLKAIIKRNELDVNDCTYVGDEIRDVEAAQTVHMPVIAVGWGINHPDVLKEHNPTHFVDKPKQLLAIAKQSLK